MRPMIAIPMALAMVLSGSCAASAQDVTGIEICTAEKSMDRRTSCLQSNVNFLQQSLNKQKLEQQQKLDTAGRQIEALKALVVTLQKSVADLQAAQKPAAAKPATPPAKETVPPAKDAAPPAKDGAK